MGKKLFEADFVAVAYYLRCDPVVSASSDLVPHIFKENQLTGKKMNVILYLFLKITKFLIHPELAKHDS